MSYDCDDGRTPNAYDRYESCIRQGIWSDPHDSFIGSANPVGTESDNWNAKVLFATGPYIASLRGAEQTYDSIQPSGKITIPVTTIMRGTLLDITATFVEDIHDRYPPHLTITDGTTSTTIQMTKSTNKIYTVSHVITDEIGTVNMSFSNARDIYGNTITTIPTSGNTFTVSNDHPPSISAITNVTLEQFATKNITVIANDPDEDSVILSVSGASFASISGNTITLSPNSSSVGDYTITVTATANGKTDTESFIVTLVRPADTSAPIIVVPSDVTMEATSVLTSVNLETATATDNTDPAPTITNNAPELFPLGITTITWTATDAAGNTISDTQIITIQDTTNPVFPVPLESKYVNTDGDSVSVDYTIPAATDIFPTAVSCVPAPNSVFPLGDTTVTCTATDSSGNTATTFNVITVSQDTKSASITQVFNNSEYVDFEDGITISNSSPRFTGISSNIESIQVLLDGTQVGANNIREDGSWKKGWRNAPLPDGIYTITINENMVQLFSASLTIDADGDGNPADNTPPSITAPADIIRESSESNTVIDDLGSPVVSDDMDSNPTITNNAPELFPSGITTITWTATDAAGNTATDTQIITIRDTSSVVPVKTTLINDSFSSTLDSWTFQENPNTVANQRYCNTQNTNVYSLTHNSNHGGSALVDYSNTCWFGIVGGVKSFTVPTVHDGSTLEMTLDYRSVAGAIFAGSGHVNNMSVLITDSDDNVLKEEILYSGARSSDLRDTDWQEKTITVNSINATKCPCDVFIYTADSWIAEWQKKIYFDNVNVTLSRPISDATNDMSNEFATNLPPNTLKDYEFFEMIFANNTKITINTKHAYDNSILIKWDEFDDIENDDYKVVIAPSSDPRNKSSYILDNNDSNTEYRFLNLEPDTQYNVAVGLRGDDATQSILKIKTAPEGMTHFDSRLVLDTKIKQDAETISLNWVDINGIGENRYRVERSVDGSDFVLTYLSPQLNHTISDPIRPDWYGKTISYKVFERVGDQKLFSNVSSLVIPAIIDDN